MGYSLELISINTNCITHRPSDVKEIDRRACSYQNKLTREKDGNFNFWVLIHLQNYSQSTPLKNNNATRRLTINNTTENYFNVYPKD